MHLRDQFKKEKYEKFQNINLPNSISIICNKKVFLKRWKLNLVWRIALTTGENIY